MNAVRTESAREHLDKLVNRSAGARTARAGAAASGGSENKARSATSGARGRPKEGPPAPGADRPSGKPSAQHLLQSYIPSLQPPPAARPTARQQDQLLEQLVQPKAAPPQRPANPAPKPLLRQPPRASSASPPRQANPPAPAAPQHSPASPSRPANAPAPATPQQQPPDAGAVQREVDAVPWQANEAAFTAAMTVCAATAMRRAGLSPLSLAFAAKVTRMVITRCLAEAGKTCGIRARTCDDERGARYGIASAESEERSEMVQCWWKEVHSVTNRSTGAQVEKELETAMLEVEALKRNLAEIAHQTEGGTGAVEEVMSESSQRESALLAELSVAQEALSIRTKFMRAMSHQLPGGSPAARPELAPPFKTPGSTLPYTTPRADEGGPFRSYLPDSRDTLSPPLGRYGSAGNRGSNVWMTTSFSPSGRWHTYSPGDNFLR
ncbi:hypothetical protein DIPPA_17197 [Diplonema papillatum]|nr:hypothetical protein DIPPA_17197 [Diplonema papillatum]